MDIYSKVPDLSGVKAKIIVFFFAGLGILILGMPSLGPPIQNSETELLLNADASIQERLALFSQNTLIPVVSPSTEEAKEIKKVPVIITAYSSTSWETDSTPFVTAAGTWVRDGVIANNYFSFGTQLKIPELFGEKVFVVEDRMNWRKDNYHIDIWFPSYWEAKEFGVKRTYIEITEG
ncbi:MAG: 3D domain-containing protein [Candidatus Pacebacteria bacterium]|nr:3D domain-containing protein [Candidatus Paceibacterota bacterium]